MNRERRDWNSPTSCRTLTWSPDPPVYMPYPLLLFFSSLFLPLLSLVFLDTFRASLPSNPPCALLLLTGAPGVAHSVSLRPLSSAFLRFSLSPASIPSCVTIIFGTAKSWPGEEERKTSRITTRVCKHLALDLSFSTPFADGSDGARLARWISCRGVCSDSRRRPIESIGISSQVLRSKVPVSVPRSPELSTWRFETDFGVKKSGKTFGSTNKL